MSALTTTPAKSSLVATFVLLALWVGGFGGGAAFLLHTQQTGSATTATVEQCDRGRTSYVCRGTWTLDGTTTTGVVEGAERDTVGQVIEVRVRGDRAYSTSLRLPVILGLLALVAPALAVLGAVKERRRTP